MSANLFDLIRAATPDLDKTAMDAPDGMSLTYRQLFERSGQAANALVALGVVAGDRVAVQIDKSPDMVVLLLACLRAGAALLPLNTAYTLAELEYFLGDAKIGTPEYYATSQQGWIVNFIVFEIGRAHV